MQAWMRRGLTLCSAMLMMCVTAHAQQRPQLSISGYVIDAELKPETHEMAAKAVVAFTHAEGADSVTFGLHPALKLSAITDEKGNTLTAERLSDGSVRVTLPQPFGKSELQHWSFTYAGRITGNDDGPVEGVKLATIAEPSTYLLYAARWFPMTAYMTGRFTAEMHITVPQGMRVFASGPKGPSKPVTLADGKPGDEYDFDWQRPGFPGTVIAGRYMDAFTAGPVRLSLSVSHQTHGTELAEQIAHQVEFLSGKFGPLEGGKLAVVELPDDALPSVWAPGIAALPGARLIEKNSASLLANTIAHQWWGSQVSPRTLSDAWITNGMARYSEMLWLEDEKGPNAAKTALQNVAAGALAYDTQPIASIGRLSAFSPEFQSVTLEKGAMIFHMLRWTIGDKLFEASLQDLLKQFTDAPIRTRDLEKIAEEKSQLQLLPFFSQWIDGTGAPEFKNNYAVYRLGNGKGFRVIGEIGQDLDLFRMPVELRIETDGKTVSRRVEIVGTETPFSVDTFGRPRKVLIDPQNWVLKNTPDLQVRVAILKGQQLLAQGDSVAALAEYHKALTANPQSSLASYRIGELLMSQRNLQAAVNSYRDALRGDGEPHWTEVWSHIAIGKIFDMTGQRDRAVNEYRLALQTNDNTQGAMNEARLRLQKPFKQQETE